MDDARRNKKLLTEAIQLKDQTMERLTRQNDSYPRGIQGQGKLDGALVEDSELKRSILTKREAAVQKYLGSQAFHHAIRPHCTREVHFEKRKWMAVLERYDDGKIDEYRQKGETFVLAVDPSSEEESDDEPSADEQTQQGEDDLEDAEDDGGTQSDIARGSTSGEDDS
ncbi:hypothetical protein DVH24_008012 [Malus domestica]|uniref:Uncharacterized protein n=1 Tax=Malus domestica TaxID=3750 RepID=A0A498JPJ3_MALDO|nr:hypothetical protein DVH24_008012 [Malus domestica]